MTDLAAELMLRTGARATTADVVRVLAELALGEPGVVGVEVRSAHGDLARRGRPAYAAVTSLELPLDAGLGGRLGSVLVALDEETVDAADLTRVAAVAAVLIDAAGGRDRLSHEAAALRDDLGRDELTGLRSRAALRPRLTEPAVDGVLYLDLDRFKAVNDQHGHRVGDLLLASVGRRIAATVRSTDEVYRVGGDEFVVCCHAMDRAGLRAMAERIAGVVAQPHDVAGMRLTVGVSIGSAVGPESLAELIDRADRDMYDVKQSAVEAR